jgi:hypothetical protein
VTGVSDFDLRELVDVAIDDLGEATQETRAIDGGERSPRARRRGGASYGEIHRLEVGFGD